MDKQTISTIKKNILLDWIYKQKNNIPVNGIMEFIESQSKGSKIVTIGKKTKTTNPSQLQ
jgi:hypothetical protein